MRDIDELIKAGVRAQREKLEANNHKKPFTGLSYEFLFNRLVDEVKELREAFEANDVDEKGYRNIRHEAADVANFAHMIILKCDKILPP